MNTLEKRCIELSYKHRLTHISSVLNTVNVLDEIYRNRYPDEPVVLGNSHAALALYVVLESRGICDAQWMVEKYGTHAARDMEHGVWVSGGSLGQPETVALGMAIAEPKTNVWLVTSDGALAEGSIWEVLRIKLEQKLTNLSITVVANGYGGYGEINRYQLATRLNPYFVDFSEPVKLPDFLQGLDGHYITLNEQQYQELMNES